MSNALDTTAVARSARRVRPALWVALAVVLAVLLLRTFLFGWYRVESGSMEPTLHASGENVLVRYQTAMAPQRFDLVVFRQEGESELIVKRVGGLSGESLQILGGDLVIDGRRLPEAAPRPPTVVVFDERWHDLSQAFALPRGPLVRDGDAWRLDGRSVADGFDATLRYTPRLTDDFLDADHRRVVGQRSVNDAVLDLELEFAEGSGQLALQLTEEGDRFELTFEVADGRAVRATLTRLAVEGKLETLATLEQPFDAAGWHRVRFGNIDNHLRVDLDQRARRLTASYGDNVPNPSQDPAYLHLLPRISITASGIVARLRRVRVERDVYYTEFGRFGTASPLQLGPGQVFVLGDNSAASRDSREWGPVELTELVGTPMCVFWPFSALRGLAAAGPRDPAEVPVR
jgi:signal peptidase I